jgi:hypothetical protein
MCAIVDCETEPKNSIAPFAEVVGGHLVVEGYVRGGFYSVMNAKAVGHRHVARISWDEDSTNVSGKATEPRWGIYMDTHQGPFQGHAYFLVLMGAKTADHQGARLRKCDGLVLKQLGDGTYQRLGIFQQRPAHESDMGDPPWRRVTIV